jgi:hypothetical protein
MYSPRLLFRLALLLMALVGSISRVVAAPSMTVTINRDGKLIDATSTLPIGQDVPVTVTWTLQEAGAGAAWESCTIPFEAPIEIDEITPSATFNGTSTYTFMPETRSVTIRFHGTALTSAGASLLVMQCRALLTDRTHVYKNVTFSIGQVPSVFIYIPQIER